MSADVVTSTVRDVVRLQQAVEALTARLAAVEVRPPSTAAPVAGKGRVDSTRPSRRARRRERAALRRLQAPPSTPVPPTSARIATATVPPTLPKAALEKISVTLSVPDAVAGHVVGRAGAGLRQIHDISHAKVSVGQRQGLSTSRAVAIRGTHREVGDAISVIGKRVARRRARQPRPKKKKTGSSTKAATTSATPAAPITVRHTVDPKGKTKSTSVAPSIPATPASVPGLLPVGSSSSSMARVPPSPQPMSVDPSRRPTSAASAYGSPMQVDAACAQQIAAAKAAGKQFARRGGAPQ